MSNSRTDATTTAVKTMEPEALAETAREVACQKVGQCFTQGTDVLLIARAVKAAKYAYIAAATARDKEVAELRARVAELEGMVPRWAKASSDECRQLCIDGWVFMPGTMAMDGKCLMVPPIPLPEAEP